MYQLWRIGQLAYHLGISEPALRSLLDDFDSRRTSLVDELTIWPVDPTKKQRDVISIRGQWRNVQNRIYRRLLLSALEPTPFSHGGVKGRSALTNARAHIGSDFLFQADVKSFFPSISGNRVYRVLKSLGWSAEVSRALTRLCTYEYHLALGLITSPVIANEIFKPIDLRIARACQRMRLTYSRFVDDITISSKYDLSGSGIEKIVGGILRQNGFRLAKEKTKFSRVEDGPTITGMRIKSHHLDVAAEYADELDRLIADHQSLANNGEFCGPLLVESEVYGKARFVCSTNRGRSRTLLGRLKKIDWNAVMAIAAQRELVRLRPRTTARGVDRPSPVEELPLVVAGRRARARALTTESNPLEPPF